MLTSMMRGTSNHISPTLMLNRRLHFQILHRHQFFTWIFLTNVNTLYMMLLSYIVKPRNGSKHSIIRFLRNGTKTMKNFIYTSLSLYITLIVISNCSLLNPGPTDLKTVNVYYQNVQGLITFSSLGSADPTLNMTKVLELNSYIATQQPDVIVLNETWLKDSIQNSELFPNRNYKICRLDRSPVSHPPHTTDPKK